MIDNILNGSLKPLAAKVYEDATIAGISKPKFEYLVKSKSEGERKISHNIGAVP